MRKILLSSMMLCYTCFLLQAQTTFSAKIPINSSTGTNPYVIASGEISSANYPDIVIGTEDGTIEWYKNNTNGTFTLQTLVSSTNGIPGGVAIANIDGINGNDIIAASYDQSRLIWFANDGSGGFDAGNSISTAISGAGSVIVGNIDNDLANTMDIAVVAYDSGDTVWFSNDGNGNFTGPNPIASVVNSGPGDLDLADFDGDGDLDVVILNSDSGNVELYDNNLIPNGTVSFTKYGNSVSTGGSYLFNIMFADLNDDGVLDILKTDQSSGKVSYHTTTTNNPATDVFTEVPLNIVSTRSANAIAADFDNDMNNDVLVTDSSSSGVIVEWLESTDVGTFNTSADIDSAQQQVYGATVADFDNDGDIDIATIDYISNDLNWFKNELIVLSNPIFESDKLNIYPNPVKDRLSIEGISDQIFTFSIYNILGKELIKTSVIPSHGIDVSFLNQGMYIIKFKGVDTSFKFVKQ